MFIIREYAACVLVVSLLAIFILVAYGIGYLLKAIGTISVRAFRAVARRPIHAESNGNELQSMWKRVGMSFRRGSLICTRTEPNVIADCPS